MLSIATFHPSPAPHPQPNLSGKGVLLVVYGVGEEGVCRPGSESTASDGQSNSDFAC